MIGSMWIDDDQCYQALRTRDVRFDGRFFVAVSSTGVYCRPVCPARLPKRENCRFFASAAAAESEGYRPCLRCRPELAPGDASVDANRRLARQAAEYLDAGAGDGESLTTLAERLGVTDRHLRRVFHSEFGVAPVEYVQTRRLLLARRLLRDTGLTITEVALAAGFNSLRRFNTLFRGRYGQPPSAWRRAASGRRTSDGELVFHLSYRPPFDWEALRDFLAARAIPGVEGMERGQYRRTALIRRGDKVHRGWLTVAPGPRNGLTVTLSESLAPVVPEVLVRLRRLFDLDAQPALVAQRLGSLAAARPGLRVPGAFDGFEAAVRAVLGQQITVKAARTLAGRVAASLGEPLDTPFEDLTTTFPEAAVVAAAEAETLGLLGIIRARVKAIQALAAACAEDPMLLSPTADVERTLAELKALPGIGDWTAQYLAMRALSWPDAFPAADLGVLKALGETSAVAVRRRAEAWRPWRAYAVMHLWFGGQENKTP